MTDAPAKRLRSLRANYDEDLHRGYVRILESEITSADPSRNVAVAGAYGSGKSSVLLGLDNALKKAKVSTISIAIATINQSEQQLKDAAGEKTLSAALQKDVIQRLLYSARPSALPQSRLPRIRGFRWWAAIATGVVIALPLIVLAILNDVSTPFRELAKSWESVQWLGAILDMVAAIVVIVLLQRALGAIRLREVAVGPAKITLGDDDKSYFDSYLDEIVYFFQRTKTRVVIFEDLDRFADTGIFQALRELNTLLNTAPQVESPVTFVYAIRDSLFTANFDPTGDPRPGVDSPASDRAKFFDLVVPLVPFISHDVAADLLVSAFEDETLPVADRPETAALVLAGQYFTDMRVIHSLRNEYDVFLAELYMKSKLSGLDKTRLLAMVMYKHAYLDDFELVRVRGSRLDVLIDDVAAAVDERIVAMDSQIATWRNDIAASLEVDRRSELAGKQLRDGLILIARTRGGASVSTIAIESGSARPATALQDSAFWRELAGDLSAGIVVELSNGAQFALSRSDLKYLLGANAEPEQWTRAVDAQLQSRLDELIQLRSSMLDASFTELATSSAYTGKSVEGSVVDVPAIAARVLGQGLALDLVRAGFIDQNFSLYTTTYYGRLLSPEARSFVYQSFEPRRSVPRFKLSPADVQALRNRTKDAVLSAPSGLNVSILDHILGDPAALPTIDLLGRLSEEEAGNFVMLYINEGAKVEEFVKQVAPRWPLLLELLSTSSRIDESTRIVLLDSAVAAMDSAVPQRVTSAAVEYLTSSYFSTHRGALVEPLGDDSATAVADLLQALGMRIGQLSGIPEPLRRQMVRRRVSLLVPEDLGVLTGNPHRLGLDSLRDYDQSAAEYAVAEIGNYEMALDHSQEAKWSVDDPSRLLEVLDVARSVNPESVLSVLRRAHPAARVARLQSVPEDVYADVVVAGRIEPRAANALAYIAARGEIDLALAGYLDSVGALTNVDELDGGDRDALATHVINAPGISTSSKLSLVGSLETDLLLSPSKLEIRDPQLAAGLIDAGELEDSADTFNHLLAQSWSVAEAGLAHSDELEIFAADLTLNSEQLQLYMESEAISASAKQAVVASLDRFVSSLTSESSAAVMDASIAESLRLAPQQLVLLIASGARPTSVIDYLGAMGDTVDSESFVSTIARLGAPFEALTRTGYHQPEIEDSPGLHKVLDRLRAEGLVGQAPTKDAGEGYVKVSMRHGPGA